MPDIVVANRTPPGRGANYVCLNQGRGRFDADCFVFSKESATTITPADVNHDGRIDLVVPHRDGGQSHIYINASTASALMFTAVPFGPPDAAIRVSQAADLDRDGLTDLVAIDEKRGLFAFFGQRGDAMSTPVPIGARGRTPYALTVADVNLDGAPDIVVGHIEAPSTVFFNAGNGRSVHARRLRRRQGHAPTASTSRISIATDVRDIAAARSEAPNVVYFATRGGQ